MGVIFSVGDAPKSEDLIVDACFSFFGTSVALVKYFLNFLFSF